MKTNQIMVREFENHKISQRTQDSFFNATELLAIYNESNTIQKRFADFWENGNTKAFIIELQNDILNVPNSPHLKTHEATRGKGGSTWMHPYLFVKFAMWLSPKFELQVIKWVYDNLIDFIIQAGDYYKQMCDEIKEYYNRNSIGKMDAFIFIREANFINLLVYGNTKGKQRNESTEFQLNLLNELQQTNAYYLSKDYSFEKRKQALLQVKEIFTFKNKK